MFYQEALLKFWFVYCVHSLLTIEDRHWRKFTTFEKAESANSLPSASFVWVLINGDVVVVVKWVSILISWGAYYPNFKV